MDCGAFSTLILTNTTSTVQDVTVGGASLLVEASRTLTLFCSGSVEVVTNDSGVLVGVLSTGVEQAVKFGLFGLAALVAAGLFMLAIVRAVS